MGVWGKRTSVLGLGFLALACGQDDGGRGGALTVGPGSGISSIGDDGGDGGGTDDDGAEGGDDGDTGGNIFDVGMQVDDGIDDGEECAEVVEDADVGLEGADIIIVIDNSVSMGNEIAQVQAEMNDFSTQISVANVDPHIVLISGFQNNSDSGICINPPLGSGMCPNADHNPPTYWRVNNWIGSHNSLARITQHYPDYAPTIRDNASTHIIVITDDDSDVAAASFDAEFKALNPKFADYRLHSIVAGNGNVYKSLSMQTGGIIADINGSFQAVFDEVASDVIETATLACEYDIPEPEGGQIFDQNEVNVEFDDGMGGIKPIGYVESAADCANVADGWYYDDVNNPQTIILCEQTCDGIQGFTLSRISVIFGCETIPAG